MQLTGWCTVRWFKRRKVNDTKDFTLPFNVGIGAYDYRGIPTLACPCGCEWLLACVMYDPETREPGMYILDGLCASCGALVTLPTPIDEGVGNDMYYM